MTLMVNGTFALSHLFHINLPPSIPIAHPPPTALPRQLQHNCTNFLVVKSLWAKTRAGLFAEKRPFTTIMAAPLSRGSAPDKPCRRIVNYRHSIEAKSRKSCGIMEQQWLFLPAGQLPDRVCHRQVQHFLISWFHHSSGCTVNQPNRDSMNNN